MKNSHKYWLGMIGAIGMVLLVIQPSVAVRSVQDGIKLCISSLIPSLFPFFIFSGVVNASLYGNAFKLLSPIRKLCRIPKGAESLLLLGFIAGYPVGAHNINEACKAGTVTRQDARRMLGFCSNPGPSFIFGILGGLFSTPIVCWVIWLIIIASSLVTGALLPGGSENCTSNTKATAVSFVDAMRSAIRAITSVCGWVIFFKMILAYVTELLPSLSEPVQALLSGTLELTNGCHGLYAVSTGGTRFIFSIVMLSFGGLCVFMQTAAATRFTGIGLYFPGKVIQCGIALLMAYALQPFLFEQTARLYLPVYILIAIIVMIAVTMIAINKKSVAFKENVMYNTKKD